MAAAAPRRLEGYLLGRAVVLAALLGLAAWAEQRGWISVAFAGLPMATAASSCRHSNICGVVLPR